MSMMVLMSLGSRALFSQNSDTGCNRSYLPIVSTQNSSGSSEAPGDITVESVCGTNVISPEGSGTPATPTPASIATSTPTSYWDPGPTATITPTPIPNYPNWVSGTYNILFNNNVDQYEVWAEYQANGTFTEEYSLLGSPDSFTVTGTWFENDGQLYVDSPDQNGTVASRHFPIEQIEDGFRITGGDLGLKSRLFERVELIDAVGDVYVSRWMQGHWLFRVAATIYTIYFDTDGTYELYQAYYGVDELVNPVESGQWSIRADQMILQPAGAAVDASTHVVTSATFDIVKISGGRFGVGTISLIRKSWIPQGSMLEFEGQYIGGDSTLIVEKNEEDSYDVRIINNGISTDASGELIQNIALQLTDGAGQVYGPYMPQFNQIVKYMDDFPIAVLNKVSDQPVSSPLTNEYGVWLVDSTDSVKQNELWFLPDGKYINFQLESRIEGTYFINGETITFDPYCSAPETRAINFIEDQMVQSGNGQTYTFHHVQAKLPDIIAEITKRDESIEAANKEFADTHKLDAIDSSYVIVPTATIFSDANVDDVFENVTVFAEREWYFRTTPAASLTIDYHFFPNGRMQSHAALQDGSIHRFGKYRIENEIVTIQHDGEAERQLPLQLGRRQIVIDELCYEHIDTIE